MSADERRLVVGVPNVLIQQFLTMRYTDAVAAAVEGLVGRPMQVSFDVASGLFQQMKARRDSELVEADSDDAKVVSFSAIRPRRQVPAEWGLDNLIACPSNALPFAAVCELGGQERPRFRFLYICGGYGQGKTALLRAVCAMASAPERGLDTLYMSAEEWCNQYYHAIQRKTTHVFRSRYRACDALLLDDIQFVEGKAGGQRELLHTVKHILGRGGRVALSGTPHPDKLIEITPALRALLQGAFPAVLVRPSLSERLAIVKELAARRGLDAVEDVYSLIAETYGDSFTTMESAVCRLALYAGVARCGRVELRAARDAFAATRPATEQPVSLASIKDVVVDALPVTAEQLTSRSRSRTVCRARQVAIYLTRQHTDASLAEIGRAFGGLKHSTVKHSTDKVARERGKDPELGHLIERLEGKLGCA
jgi:chromosomal replication initiator protein